MQVALGVKAEHHNARLCGPDFHLLEITIRLGNRITVSLYAFNMKLNCFFYKLKRLLFCFPSRNAAREIWNKSSKA